MTTIIPADMSNRALIDATHEAVADERRGTAALLQLLVELDGRRLYLSEGCASLFSYCTQMLHLSEHAAYHRIEAARAARRFPIILSLVAAGDVTLTAIAMLRSHLTPENHETLLAAARHKSKREVEQQIACLAPKPDAKSLVRRIASVRPLVRELRCAHIPLSFSELPCAADSAVENTRHLMISGDPAPAKTTHVATSTGPAPKVSALASDRYLLRVTLTADAHAKLRRAQDLLRHAVSNGDPAEIVGRALTLLVDQLERTKAGTTSKPRSVSAVGNRQCAPRHVPARVRRHVWARDQGRCAFVGPAGRCAETGRLEFHHVVAFARGGRSDISNIALRCRAHNKFESDALFGAWQPG